MLLNNLIFYKELVKQSQSLCLVGLSELNINEWCGRIDGFGFGKGRGFIASSQVSVLHVRVATTECWILGPGQLSGCWKD